MIRQHAGYLISLLVTDPKAGALAMESGVGPFISFFFWHEQPMHNPSVSVR